MILKSSIPPLWSILSRILIYTLVTLDGNRACYMYTLFTEALCLYRCWFLVLWIRWAVFVSTFVGVSRDE
jgi:hypothetical protein